jgi:hypothetical protein
MRPDALRQLHREFLRAGAEVMVALTYYAHREKLRAVGRDGDLEAMNREAVRIANEVAAEGDALVAGNVCNTWSFDLKEPHVSGTLVREQYEEQLGWAVEEGIDFVIAETNDYVGEAVIALEVCQQLGLPAMVTFASVQPEKTYDGYDYIEACRVLADKGAALVGLNCSRGPETMLPLLERIRAAVDVRSPRSRSPIGRRRERPPSSRSCQRPAVARSRSSSSPSSTRGTRWRTSRVARATSASTTSASAAAAHRTTSAPWRRPWAGPPRPAAIPRPWSSTRSSAATTALSAWTAGAPPRSEDRHTPAALERPDLLSRLRSVGARCRRPRGPARPRTACSAESRPSLTTSGMMTFVAIAGISSIRNSVRKCVVRKAPSNMVGRLPPFRLGRS